MRVGETCPPGRSRLLGPRRLVPGRSESGRCTVLVTVDAGRVVVFPHGVDGLRVELSVDAARELRSALGGAIGAAG